MRITCAVILVCSAVAMGRNVDLATLPPRDSVQLTIYNAEDITLVREMRHISFKKGINLLQFSWANTLIDPTSVFIQFPHAGDKLELLDTTYPHDKPEILYWHVQSELDGDAEVVITYFTSGLSWQADYSCIANPGETQMDVTGFVRVLNNSGEDYENAQVRLVVGTINLVEKIAELARRRYAPETKDESRAFGGYKLRQQAAGEVLMKGYALSNLDSDGEQELYFDRAVHFGLPKEIAKESLGEYFIYTVEGTETITTGWSKRLRSFEGRGAAMKVEYRYRPAEYGPQMVRMFVLTNNEDSKLGKTPLPDGTVRVYRDNGLDGLSFLTSQTIKYVPIGDKIELNLGPDPRVVHEWINQRSWRDNFWFKRVGMDVYRNLDGTHKIEIDNELAGWEDHTQYIERIRNYSGKAIDVEIRRTFAGHTFFVSKLEPTLHDYQTVQMTAACPADQRTDLSYHIRTLQGYLAKQQNVTLQTGE